MSTEHSAGPATGQRRTSPSGSLLVGRADIDRTAAITRSLLGYGVLAGPFYLVVGLAQALTRDGYDLTRHDLSLLANGPLGWIQIANLVLSGLMTVAAGIGMRRALRALGGGRGTVWGPRLVVGYGLGLVGAGIFVADPMNGVPARHPGGPARDDHGGRDRAPGVRGPRVPVPDRRLPVLRAVLRRAPPRFDGMVLPRHGGGVPGRLRRHRERLGEPGRRTGLLGGGRLRLGLAGRGGDRPVPTHAPADPATRPLKIR